MGGMSYSADNYVSLFDIIPLDVNGSVVSDEWKSHRAHSEKLELSLSVCCKVNTIPHLLME